MSTMIERIHELEAALEGERRAGASLAEQVRQLRTAGEAAEALEVRVKDLEAQLLDRLAVDPTDEAAPGLDSLRDRLAAILDCWDRVDRPELLELAEDELRRAHESYRTK